MAKTHVVTIVSMGPNGFSPGRLAIEPGDSVIWENLSDMEHTATSMPGQQKFFDERVEPESPSKPVLFEQASPQSGIEYFCRNHPVMVGYIVVQPSRAPLEVAQLASQMQQGLQSFARADWERMAHIVGTMWVIDMVDDFLFSKTVHTAADNARVQAAYDAIEAWWRGVTGDPNASLSDAEGLVRRSPAEVEVLGRRLREQYSVLRPLVFRSPSPVRPDDQGGPDVLYPGQSSDEFGKAIGVNHTSLLIRTIEPLEEEMAGPASVIERNMDRGIPISSALQAAHDDAKAKVLPEHYHILADHQYRGLTKLFGAPAFDEAKFMAGVKRMTVRGEWDAPSFVGWHWMRWIQSYLTVLDNNVVPDMFRPMPTL